MSEKDRERDKERGTDRKREREMYNMVALFLFLKGMRCALAPFSYLVRNSFITTAIRATEKNPHTLQ